jgi:hypothetical protein
LEKRLSFLNMAPEQRSQYAAARGRADDVAHAFGDSAGAPSWQAGESLGAYRARLLNPYRQHCPQWAQVDFTTLQASTPMLERLLSQAETEVFSAALDAARDPDNYPPGTLKEIVTRDATGRKISNFVGDIEVTFGPFKLPSRRARFVRS